MRQSQIAICKHSTKDCPFCTVFAVLYAYIFLQFMFLLLLQKNKHMFYEHFGRKTTGTAGVEHRQTVFCHRLWGM
jgi:hypothetical protein